MVFGEKRVSLRLWEGERKDEEGICVFVVCGSERCVMDILPKNHI